MDTLMDGYLRSSGQGRQVVVTLDLLLFWMWSGVGMGMNQWHTCIRIILRHLSTYSIDVNVTFMILKSRINWSIIYAKYDPAL